MTDRQLQYDAAMERLRQKFSARCTAEAEFLQAYLDGSHTDRQEVIRRLHGLAGIAGSFGFMELGEKAAQLERAMIAEQSESDLASLVTDLRQPIT